MSEVNGQFVITSVRGYEIIDSRGRPTIRTCVSTKSATGCADAPAGASKGIHEALELRDGEKRIRGYGVRKSVFVVENIIAPAIIGMDVRQQEKIDNTIISLDGTKNKQKLGANSTISTSIAVSKAASYSIGLELFEYIGGKKIRYMPVPLLNVINGGAHAGNKLDFQEFMIVPINSDSFSDAIWMSIEVYMSLKELIAQKFGKTNTMLGDEGGFAPPIEDPREALNILERAITSSGYKLGLDFYLALDVAASHFYEPESKAYMLMGRKLTSMELADYYLELVEEYPIKSIEDPFHEEDFESFSYLKEKTKKKGVLIVGDDLYVTNINRLNIGIEKNATSAVIVKPNQIGTLTETISFHEKAIRTGMKTIMSHRSGDTEDNYIADLSVGLQSDFIKTGAPARGERTSKYNRLIMIEKSLEGQVIYKGKYSYSII